jgi:hypothetical protein
MKFHIAPEEIHISTKEAYALGPPSLSPLVTRLSACESAINTASRPGTYSNTSDEGESII